VLHSLYTNGKGKNEETPANSYAVDTVESDDTADSHNVDAGDADTEDRNVNGTDGTENRDVDDTDGKQRTNHR